MNHVIAVRGQRRGRWFLGVLAVVAVMLTACASAEPAELSEPPPPGLSRDDAGFVHVHELAIDPAGEGLLVAAHTGLFRIDDGKVERLDDQYHDIEALEVAASKRYLSSGHPDFRSAELGLEPERLGLMESRDAGETWNAVSLSSEADFHALQTRGATVYGADAVTGGFMVSRDGGESWETRSKPALEDFLIAPGEATTVLGVGAQGTVLSINGGRDWEQLDTPRLTTLAAERSRVWAIAPEGSVYLSEDVGRTWSRRGILGAPPEALLATPNKLFAAGTGVGVVSSDDGGRTWRSLYRAYVREEGVQP